MREGRGFRGRWAGHLAVLTVAVMTIGCTGAETTQHRTRESEGYYKQGMSVIDTDQQRAFVAFQKSIQLDPDNYDAHYALGHIYFERKEYAEADREFRACLALTPDSGESLNYLGRTLIARSKLPEAVDVLRKAIAQPLYATPDYSYTLLGDVLQLQGDIPGAIRAYQDAMKINPPNVPKELLYFHVGRLYLQQGENGKAREAFAQAKALDPNGAVGKEAARMMQSVP
jgi:type IV pilus assembly protein PilF